MYNCLIDDIKISDDKEICVNEPKKQKPGNNIGATTLMHSVHKLLPMELIVECSIQNSWQFGFKIMSPHFFEKPIFRFESSGTTHRNKNKNLPINEQQILTPHFHRYDDKYNCDAYRPQELDGLESGNCDLGPMFKLFCTEANIAHKNNEMPVVNSTPKGELNLSVCEKDPLENIIFV